MGVEDAAYAFGGCVVVVGGVDGEELGDELCAVGEGGVDVGEGPAAGEVVDGGWMVSVANMAKES